MVTTSRRGAAMSIAALVLVAGCGQETVQCGACPPPAYVELVTASGAAPPTTAMGTAHVCVEKLECEDLAVGGPAVTLRLGPQVRPRQLDGRDVTVTVNLSTGGSLRGTGRFTYRLGHGVCSCSGSRAHVTLVEAGQAKAPTSPSATLELD